MTSKLCSLAEESWSEWFIWYELRYDRITAPKIFETTHCKTKDGSLTRQRVGAVKVFSTEYMKRDKLLEKEVLLSIAKKMNISRFRNSGLIITYVSSIASPDAIGDDFIVEIKYPAKQNTVTNYIVNGKIKKKCKAQMQLQMLAIKTKKGYFCIADQNFEKTWEVTVMREYYDKEYINKLTESAVIFWKDHIFPKLFQSL